VANIEIIGGSFTSNKPYLFRAIYEWILDNDGTPHLLIDATEINVSVPWEHVKDGQIVLNAAPSAIRDWIADQQAISFSARFSGKAQNIFVPMKALKAVYAQENGIGMVFPEEKIGQAKKDGVENAESTDSSPSKSKKEKKEKNNSHLTLIK